MTEGKKLVEYGEETNEKLFRLEISIGGKSAKSTPHSMPVLSTLETKKTGFSIIWT